MFIYIINGVNGKLFYQTSFLNVDQNSGIQLIFDENILIVNYKNYVVSPHFKPKNQIFPAKTRQRENDLE